MRVKEMERADRRAFRTVNHPETCGATDCSLGPLEFGHHTPGFGRVLIVEARILHFRQRRAIRVGHRAEVYLFNWLIRHSSRSSLVSDSKYSIAGSISTAGGKSSAYRLLFMP